MRIHLPEYVEVDEDLPVKELFEALNVLGLKLSASHKDLVAVQSFAGLTPHHEGARK